MPDPLQEPIKHELARGCPFGAALAFNSPSTPPQEIIELTDARGESINIEKLPPGTDLGEAELSALARKLFPLYVAGFMQEAQLGEATRTASFFDDLKEHLSSAQRISLITREGALAGFIVSQLIDTSCGPLYHLGGIIIDPKEQGRGIGFRAVRAELQASRATLLGFHTESAAMYAIGEKLAVFSPELVREFQSHIGTQNPHEGIDRGRYGRGSLYGDLERFKSQAIPDLNIEKGDAVIFIGEVYEK